MTAEVGPLNDIDIAVPEGEDLREVLSRNNMLEAWNRDGCWIATGSGSWLRSCDFRTDDGWRAMFVPNGAGTVEWFLGWSISIPESFFLMILPLSREDIEVPIGVLTSRMIDDMTVRGGFSLPFRPRRSTKIERGSPIAKICLIHPDTIHASARLEIDEG